MGYFDQPDGKDCLGKTTFTTQVGTVLGLTGSMYAFLFKYGRMSAVQGLVQGTNITLTMAALGAVFGATTCAVSAARGGKDSRMNYFIGGCTTGALVGVRTHSYAMGFGMCAGLGSLAAVYKHGLMEGWPNVFEEPKY